MMLTLTSNIRVVPLCKKEHHSFYSSVSIITKRVIAIFCHKAKNYSDLQIKKSKKVLKKFRHNLLVIKSSNKLFGKLKFINTIDGLHIFILQQQR